MTNINPCAVQPYSMQSPVSVPLARPHTGYGAGLDLTYVYIGYSIFLFPACIAPDPMHGRPIIASDCRFLGGIFDLQFDSEISVSRDPSQGEAWRTKWF